MDESICCQLSSLEGVFLSFLGKKRGRAERKRWCISSQPLCVHSTDRPSVTSLLSCTTTSIGKHLIISAQFSGFPFYKRKFVSLRQSFSIASWQKSSVYALMAKAYVHLLYYHCLLGKISLNGSCEVFRFELPEKLFPRFFLKYFCILGDQNSVYAPKQSPVPRNPCHQRLKGVNSIKSKHLTVFNEISPWEKYEITLLLFLFQESWVIANCFGHKIMVK